MPKNPVFLDSNGWVALLNSRDPLHPRADALWRHLGQTGRPIFLTDWIVAETGNGLARTPARMLLSESFARFQRCPQFRIVTVSPELRTRALALYSERPDKTWGLVDCASFVVMADAGITEVFTTDRHFEQAGFKCLLPVVVGE